MVTYANASPAVNFQYPTDGAALVYRNIDVQNTGKTIKGSPGGLLGFVITNNAGSVRFVKLYDLAAAPAATDTPLLTIQIPANNSVPVPIGPLALAAFAKGIGIRGTTGVADADTGAPTANDIVCNIFYI